MLLIRLISLRSARPAALIGYLRGDKERQRRIRGDRRLARVIVERVEQKGDRLQPAADALLAEGAKTTKLNQEKEIQKHNIFRRADNLNNDEQTIYKKK